MPKRASKDPNVAAARIVAEATATREKNPMAVALGKLGGAKGGHARAASLSAKKRTAIAKLAARVRWSKKRPS
jgi:nanoRNase/pAp phosphatase (c-di-AMP/oligoRNAs hydrolase)